MVDNGRSSSRALAALPPFPSGSLQLPDKDLAIQFWAWWVTAQLEPRGIHHTRITDDLAEQVRLATLDLDGDLEEYAGLEKALRLLSRGDLITPPRLIRQYFRRVSHTIADHNEALTGSRRQRALARKPRRARPPNALLEEIIKIVQREPDIKDHILQRRLREPELSATILTVTDTDIEFSERDGTVKSIKVSNLKNYKSRAKEILKNANKFRG